MAEDDGDRPFKNPNKLKKKQKKTKLNIYNDQSSTASVEPNVILNSIDITSSQKQFNEHHEGFNLYQNRYEFDGECLACGAQGVITKGWDYRTMRSVVKKVLYDDIKVAFYEKDILDGVVDENLIEFYDYSTINGVECLIMEYCEADLDELCKSENGLTEEFIKENKLISQLLHGIVALHENYIIHLDIKAKNVLVQLTDDNGITLKLADFGCSVRFSDDLERDEMYTSGMLGTETHMAPEVMLSEDQNIRYTFSADIWSLGCCIIEMLTGKRPWNSKTKEQIYMQNVFNGPTSPPIPEKISKECKEFLELCFELNPALRPSASQLLDHPLCK